MHWLQNLELPNNTFAPVPFSEPSRAMAQAELVEHYGISPFENLNIADARVCDMSVDSIRSVPVGTSTRSTCDRLGRGQGQPLIKGQRDTPRNNPSQEYYSRLCLCLQHRM